MSRRLLWITLSMLVGAACGSEGSSPDDGQGGSGGGGGNKDINDEPAGCIQMPKCAPSLSKAVSGICVDDACVPVGQEDENGAALRSSLLIYSRYSQQVSAAPVSSVGVTLFHPLRPNGEKLSCADLLALQPDNRRNAGYTNVVSWNSYNVALVQGNDVVPAVLENIPVNDPEVEYLLLSELWSGHLHTITQVNQGTVLGIGCIDGIVAEPGAYSDGAGTVDERYTRSVRVNWVGTP